jgi:hypothetical protein
MAKGSNGTAHQSERVGMPGGATTAKALPSTVTSPRFSVM